MYSIGLNMLVGDRGKYIGLILAIALSTILITQQASVFFGVIARTSGGIRDVRDADIWIMDHSVNYFDAIKPMKDDAIYAVRSVNGVAWAVPFSKNFAVTRTGDGKAETALVFGIDDVSLIGAPKRILLGRVDALRRGDAVLVDRAGFHRLWPRTPLELGKTVELNDHRLVVVGITEANAPFSTNPVIYMNYTEARRYLPQGRHSLDFILAKARTGLPPETVAGRIETQTGLGALSGADFRRTSERYYLVNTAIPINFGMVIILGATVGLAVVALTFTMFVSENAANYAVLKAMGMSPAALARLVLAQAAAIGLQGFGIGLGAAAGSLALMAKSILEFRGMFVPIWIPTVTFFVILLVVLASAALAIRKVNQIDPGCVFRV